MRPAKHVSEVPHLHQESALQDALTGDRLKPMCKSARLLDLKSGQCVYNKTTRPDMPYGAQSRVLRLRQ
jgi:hypothetical protein